MHTSQDMVFFAAIFEKKPTWGDNGKIATIAKVSLPKLPNLSRVQLVKHLKVRYVSVTVEIWPLLTCLIANFSVSPPHRGGITVSSETNLLFNSWTPRGLNCVACQLSFQMVDWKASTLLFPVSPKGTNIWFDLLKFRSEVKVDV